jgi:hypothetical protein
LRSQDFNNNELTEDVRTWLTSQTADLFKTGLQKLIPWCMKIPAVLWLCWEVG